MFARLWWALATAPGPWYFSSARSDQNRLAPLVNAMQSEYILGKIDPYGDNIHGLPLSNE